jgi:hypothetical protein
MPMLSSREDSQKAECTGEVALVITLMDVADGAKEQPCNAKHVKHTLCQHCGGQERCGSDYDTGVVLVQVPLGKEWHRTPSASFPLSAAYVQKFRQRIVRAFAHAQRTSLPIRNFNGSPSWFRLGCMFGCAASRPMADINTVCYFLIRFILLAVLYSYVSCGRIKSSSGSVELWCTAHVDCGCSL